MIIRKESIPLFKGVDLSIRRLPYLVAETGVKGPVIVITAAIHGDEVTGTSVVSRLFKRLEGEPLLRGTLYGFPILNPSGFESLTRNDLYAEADINRNFPGRQDGNTAERHAWLILSTIMHIRPDFVIDLHADTLNSIVYSLIDDIGEPKALTTFRKSAILAERLRIPWVVDNAKSAGFPPQKCFTGSLIANGIPAVTVELGGLNIIAEGPKQTALESLWNLLTYLKMVDGQRIALPDKIPAKVLTVSKRIYTQTSGIMLYKVKAGEKLTYNQIIGKVINVFGETIEIIRSPVRGILLSHEDYSVSFPGKTMFTIAEQVDSSLFKLL